MSWFFSGWGNILHTLPGSSFAWSFYFTFFCAFWDADPSDFLRGAENGLRNPVAP
jgi:hypothetical protein